MSRDDLIRALKACRFNDETNVVSVHETATEIVLMPDHETLTDVAERYGLALGPTRSVCDYAQAELDRLRQRRDIAQDELNSINAKIQARRKLLARIRYQRRTRPIPLP
jgi:hypothetical protein